MILLALAKELYEWIKNITSPIETVEATVIAKRKISIQYHRRNGTMPHTSTSSKYYVTFELSDKSHKELRVKGHQFGLLFEQDKGQLVYQGTRFRSFQA